MRSLVGTTVVLVAALVAYVAYYFFYEFPERQLKIKSQPSYSILVESGSSLNQVLQQLHRDGVVRYPRLISVYARLKEQTQIHRGEYIVKRQDTIADLLALLNKGKVTYRSITLIEGWSLAQIKQQMGEVFALDEAMFNPETYQIEADNLEGWVFPDTYYYSMHEKPDVLLNQAVQKMQRLLDQQWQLRDSNLPYKNAYEMLIMASLIEKETAVDSERELIASVFINRIRKNMKLQTDPTVIYAMGAAYQGNIRRKDLSMESPYNTYHVRGLPPTPIAVPGLRSLEAAAKPANSPYLYFVAKGNGEHYFSTSLDEHNQAVDKYQRYARSQNYRSTPAKE